MKAMLLSQYKHLEVVDMPKPEVGDNDLLVEVRACGICGSDIHGWDGSTWPPRTAAGDGPRSGRCSRGCRRECGGLSKSATG